MHNISEKIDIANLGSSCSNRSSLFNWLNHTPYFPWSTCLHDARGQRGRCWTAWLHQSVGKRNWQCAAFLQHQPHKHTTQATRCLFLTIRHRWYITIWEKCNAQQHTKRTGVNASSTVRCHALMTWCDSTAFVYTHDVCYTTLINYDDYIMMPFLFLILPFSFWLAVQRAARETCRDNDQSSKHVRARRWTVAKTGNQVSGQQCTFILN